MMEFLLKTKFMKGILSKIVMKMVKKGMNYDVDIQIEDLAIDTVENGDVVLNVSLSGKMKKDDFEDVVKKYV